MWIVDTSVWVDFFNGNTTPQTTLLLEQLGHQPIAIGDLVLCEILQGFRQQADFEAAINTLKVFPVHAMVGAKLAQKSAENYRFLCQHGVTIGKTIDCLIATFVIESGFQLLHNDRNFDPFEMNLGLKVVR